MRMEIEEVNNKESRKKALPTPISLVLETYEDADKIYALFQCTAITDALNLDWDPVLDILQDYTDTEARNYWCDKLIDVTK